MVSTHPGASHAPAAVCASGGLAARCSGARCCRCLAARAAANWSQLYGSPLAPCAYTRQAMEERQRQLRAGDAQPPRLSTQHIYNAVNAQMGIIQAQASSSHKDERESYSRAGRPDFGAAGGPHPGATLDA